MTDIDYINIVDFDGDDKTFDRVGNGDWVEFHELVSGWYNLETIDKDLLLFRDKELGRLIVYVPLDIIDNTDYVNGGYTHRFYIEYLDTVNTFEILDIDETIVIDEIRTELGFKSISNLIPLFEINKLPYLITKDENDNYVLKYMKELKNE